jgi:hemerythrin-like domain-containing protein
MTSLISRWHAEHVQFSRLLNQLDTLLQEALGDAVVLRCAVETAAALYLVYYRHHLATEETSILPRAAKLLTDEDWQVVSRAVPPDSEPQAGAPFASSMQ